MTHAITIKKLDDEEFKKIRIAKAELGCKSYKELLLKLIRER